MPNLKATTSTSGITEHIAASKNNLKFTESLLKLANKSAGTAMWENADAIHWPWQVFIRDWLSSISSILTISRIHNEIAYLPSNDEPITGKYERYGCGERQKNVEANAINGKLNGLCTECYINGYLNKEQNHTGACENIIAQYRQFPPTLCDWDMRRGLSIFQGVVEGKKYLESRVKPALYFDEVRSFKQCRKFLNAVWH